MVRLALGAVKSLSVMATQVGCQYVMTELLKAHGSHAAGCEFESQSSQTNDSFTRLIFAAIYPETWHYVSE